MESSFLSALQDLRESSGVVIPAYFPSSQHTALASQLLRDTAVGCERQLGAAPRVCISVDGQNAAVETAAQLRAEHGFSVVVSRRNKGKLGAVHEGLQLLLRDQNVRYFLLVDQDGDHFPNELTNFIRTARHVATAAQTDRVLVIGRRSSRHHPMGYLRGELEELADRILIDCLQYHAALTGVPLNLQFALLLDDYPDFHSGFKLLTRPLVESFVQNGFPLHGMAEDGVYRHAVEAVLSVEAWLAGGVIASVPRTTFNEQPMTTFGLLERCRLLADKIFWPARRLAVPASFLGQWLDNHLARLRLTTLAPTGRDELLEIRALVRKAVDLPEAPKEIVGPAFL
ncbi:MAG: glycosyltransferase [Acidobacteria bacterium]|nr:MAG: glycosyltransferase [Acidobacteriota bacterium]